MCHRSSAGGGSASILTCNTGAGQVTRFSRKRVAAPRAEPDGRPSAADRYVGDSLKRPLAQGFLELFQDDANAFSNAMSEKCLRLEEGWSVAFEKALASS